MFQRCTDGKPKVEKFLLHLPKCNFITFQLYNSINQSAHPWYRHTGWLSLSSCAFVTYYFSSYLVYIIHSASIQIVSRILADLILQEFFFFHFFPSSSSSLFSSSSSSSTLMMFRVISN